MKGCLQRNPVYGWTDFRLSQAKIEGWIARLACQRLPTKLPGLFYHGRAFLKGTGLLQEHNSCSIDENQLTSLK